MLSVLPASAAIVMSPMRETILAPLFTLMFVFLVSSFSVWMSPFVSKIFPLEYEFNDALASTDPPAVSDIESFVRI